MKDGAKVREKRLSKLYNTTQFASTTTVQMNSIIEASSMQSTHTHTHTHTNTHTNTTGPCHHTHTYLHLCFVCTPTTARKSHTAFQFTYCKLHTTFTTKAAIMYPRFHKKIGQNFTGNRAKFTGNREKSQGEPMSVIG